MNKKITKQQREAIEYLQLDLDELMNKPRRLFGALRKFAEAFPKHDQEYTNEILDSIDEFERGYYLHANIPDMTRFLMEHSRKTLKELTSRKRESEMYNPKEDYVSGFRAGVEEAIKVLTNKMAKEIIDELN